MVIEMLAGALTLAYCLAALHFLRFWRRTADRLFLLFSIAFGLFAVNQVMSSIPVVTDETAGYEYLLRVVGFIVILVAILDKNVSSGRRSHGSKGSPERPGRGVTDI